MRMVDPRRAAGAWIVVVALAAGCGGATPTQTTPGNDAGADAPSTDIAGWFSVTSYQTGDCGMTAPSNLGSPFVWIEHQVSRYVVRACAGSSEADCTGTYFYDFTQPIPDGWHAEGGTAFFSAGCTLTYERTDLTVIGDALHATSLTVQVNQDVPQAQCTLDAARALTSPCTHETDLAGTRL